ncbi:MAG: hypothetical protein HFJ35_02140 [Clostridia bacterium]|nr:hypothetical protein [Clostridia bacterium]
MKKNNKDKLKQKRIVEKKRREEQQRIINKQIINTISNEQIMALRNFNISTFSDEEVNKEEMLNCLRVLLEIVMNSSYLDEVIRMTRQNVSSNWFDKEINEEFVREILLKELETAKVSSTESIALKLCFWANRIAHHLENEVIQKQPKHKMNEIYIKYFLNPKYHYDLANVRDINNENIPPEIAKRLEDIVIKECTTLCDIDTVEKLNNLFLGLSIRNELWTLKQQMIKSIILNISRNNTSNVKVTALNEKKDLSISGSETMRLIIREINGIAPVVMHCDKEKVDDFLQQNNIQPISSETSNKIIEFAKNGKVGIHFILDEEGIEILEYEADENFKARILNDIVYRGDNEDGR